MLAAVVFLLFCTFLLTGCQLSDIAGRGITRRVASRAVRFALGISKAPAQSALAALPAAHTACTAHIQNRTVLSVTAPEAITKTERAMPTASVAHRPAKTPRAKTERIWVIDFGQMVSDAEEVASRPSEVDPAAMTALASRRRTIRIATVNRTSLHLRQSDKETLRTPCRETNRLPDPTVAQSSS